MSYLNSWLIHPSTPLNTVPECPLYTIPISTLDILITTSLSLSLCVFIFFHIYSSLLTVSAHSLLPWDHFISKSDPHSFYPQITIYLDLGFLFLAQSHNLFFKSLQILNNPTCSIHIINML
ncbi:hypothetical protein QVD17_32896 [Tagetes erecta]|uniref:Uncharacterized protein n=1 Tax=Tagetes erecta TaxID=13708 RepID=A0AAD8JY83_TARER|nr:hypothetical protein QVD17_32896 [Tagetes erecta]